MKVTKSFEPKILVGIDELTLVLTIAGKQWQKKSSKNMKKKQNLK